MTYLRLHLDPYLVAAYAIALGTLLGYAIQLRRRERQLLHERRMEEASSTSSAPATTSPGVPEDPRHS